MAVFPPISIPSNPAYARRVSGSGVAVGLEVAVSVGPGVGVGVGVAVGLEVAVTVGSGVSVGVNVGLGVDVAVGCGVSVGPRVSVGVDGRAEIVAGGAAGVGETPQASNSTPNEAPPPNLKKSRRESGLGLWACLVMAILQNSRRKSIDNQAHGMETDMRDPQQLTLVLMPSQAHHFAINYNTTPTVCQVCHLFLAGLPPPATIGGQETLSPSGSWTAISLGY